LLPKMTSLLFALGACNAVFLGLVVFIVVRGVQDKFVTYFLFGEYFAAMLPISVIGILEPQILEPIIVILFMNIILLILLGLLPSYFRRK
jgi:hypothetical protein